MKKKRTPATARQKDTDVGEARARVASSANAATAPRANATTTKERGDRGEALVALYLVRELGWRVLDQNVNYRVGELDIVAEDGDSLVFVEVRSRRGKSGPPPAHTVTLPKQRRLTRAASLYLARYKGACVGARFDVVGVDLSRSRVAQHIRGAFNAADF